MTEWLNLAWAVVGFLRSRNVLTHFQYTFGDLRSFAT
jgi:hypothetical protein